jgi:hypothetical protein
MPEKAAVRWQTWASAEGEYLLSGKAGHRGGRAEPSPLRGGARRGLPAARSASPVRSARGTRRNEQASWRARTASGHEHQGDDAKPRLDPAKLKSRHLRGSGRRPLPEPPPGIVDVYRNLMTRVGGQIMREGTI